MSRIGLLELPTGAKVSDVKRTGLDHAWCQVCGAEAPRDQVRITFEWCDGWGDVLTCPTTNCYDLALAANEEELRLWFGRL